MKNLIVGLMVVGSMASASARAESVVGGVGNWKGEGVVYEMDGKEYPFDIELGIVKLSDHDIRVEGKVLLPSGGTKEFTEIMSDCGYGFTISSNLGMGRGRWLGEGLSQSYIEDTAGHAFATTMVRDGENERRVLVTELQNGQAVRFIRQKIVRAK